MADRQAESHARLAALGVHLFSLGFRTKLGPQGLTVINPEARGCCEEVTAAADTITCRPRVTGDDPLWFWSSWGEPLSPADRLGDVTATIKGYLS